MSSWTIDDFELEKLTTSLALCEGNPLMSGESTDGRDSPHIGPVMRSFDLSLLLVWASCRTNNPGDGDLRRIDAYVTSLHCTEIESRGVDCLAVNGIVKGS